MCAYSEVADIQTYTHWQTYIRGQDIPLQEFLDARPVAEKEARDANKSRKQAKLEKMVKKFAWTSLLELKEGFAKSTQERTRLR